MNFKQKTHTHCMNQLNIKIAGLTQQLSELRESVEDDTKSSAGDKHETSRAMLQIEQENCAKQINELMQQVRILETLKPSLYSGVIQNGSLIITNKGYLYISIPLGKIKVENKEVITCTARSPLGSKLLGLNSGDSVEFNGNKYTIESIF